MLTVEGKSTIVGLAELRKVMRNVLQEMKTHKVILTKRNRPVGVLVDYEEFRRMERVIEALEDFVLGNMARERAQRKDRKTLTLEDVERKLGLR
jgi:prevent-host-death family protein